MVIPCFHGGFVQWPRFKRVVNEDRSTLKCTKCKATFSLPDTDGHGLQVGSKCPGFAKGSSKLGSCPGVMRYGKMWTKVGFCDCGAKK